MTRTGIVTMVAAVVCSAQPRYIGTASCPASFWVDSTGVTNHATLFENSTVETEGAPAKLLIEGGVRILLDVHSRAQVDVTHLVLEKGRAQLDSGKDYKLEVRTIRVSLSKPSARAIVSVSASGEVEVAALSGTVHVANAEGVAVANVVAGRVVDLRLGQASEAVMLTGSIIKAGAAYTLRDEASAVTVELRGTNVANNAGRRVQVSGTIMPSEHSSAGADQVVVAKTIQVMPSGIESAAITGSRARSALPSNNTAAANSGNTADAGSADGASAGSTAGTAGTASTAGTAGTAGAAGAASTAGVVGAGVGIGISTAVIAGIAVAAAAGTAAGIVATESHKAPISAGR